MKIGYIEDKQNRFVYLKEMFKNYHREVIRIKSYDQITDDFDIIYINVHTFMGNGFEIANVVKKIKSNIKAILISSMQLPEIQYNVAYQQKTVDMFIVEPITEIAMQMSLSLLIKEYRYA